MPDLLLLQARHCAGFLLYDAEVSGANPLAGAYPGIRLCMGDYKLRRGFRIVGDSGHPK